MPLFLIAIGILAMLAFVLYSWYFAEEQKIRRALKNAPVSAIQDAQAGQAVKLVGRVRAQGPLLASPFSHRACTLYDATVEEYRSNGRSGSWYTLIREVEAVDFLIEDSTGRALVRTGAIKVAPSKDAELNSGVFNDATPELEAFLARHGQKSTGWVFNKRLRYREGVFEPGETVAVLGTVRWEHDPDPREVGKGYRDMPKRAVVEPLPEGYVLASDLPDTR